MKETDQQRKENQQVNLHGEIQRAEAYYYNPDASHFDPKSHEVKHSQLRFIAEKNPTK